MTTVSDLSAGEVLAEKIVEARLAACVQVLPAMTSVYVWKGSVERAEEHLLLIKTGEEKLPDLKSFVAANHDYEVPEFVALNAADVTDSYLAWVAETLGISEK